MKFDVGDIIEHKDYTMEYAVEETPDLCFFCDGPAYALRKVVTGWKGSLHIFARDEVERDYILVQKVFY